MDRKWWTLTAAVVGVFMLLLDAVVVSIALPGFRSLADFRWVIAASALTVTVGLRASGPLADLFGRRRPYVVGSLLTGTLFFALACDGEWPILRIAWSPERRTA